MKTRIVLASLALTLITLSAPAFAESGEADCNGIDFDVKRPLAVAKVTAKPRVHYVKSAWDDPSCPADTETCKAKAYLVPGDLVLVGRTRGAYTCVSYQSPRDNKQAWTNGWMSTSALEPVAAAAAPKPSDWLGTWKHTGGEITIERAKAGKLAITGEHVYPAAQEVHTGVIGAEATPAGAYLSFAEDGTVEFDKAEEGACQVRMQRLGALLLVEDNGACGGVMVTFTGLYRRER
jgi:hypothetical protein